MDGQYTGVDTGSRGAFFDAPRAIMRHPLGVLMMAAGPGSAAEPRHFGATNCSRRRKRDPDLAGDKKVMDAYCRAPI
jgi:hypothetical protein